MPHDLPGTDSRFHEARRYLSPVKFHGRDILAAHGSCKEQGCGYSSAWVTSGARDRGMFLHRALKVREARVIYFGELFGNASPNVGRLLNETADNNSHFFAPWKELVWEFFHDLTGDPEGVMPDRNYLAEYRQGHTAMDTAKFLFENH